jgi:mono/diheme cytochrome c family protein
MPMTGPPFLSEQEISLIESWIAAGLPPGASAPAAPVATRTAVRPEPGQPVTYAHVAPIFATRCAKCHTQKGLMGPAPEGYLLTSYDATLAAGDRIRVAPGAAEASELVRRVRGQARPRMPFDGPPFLSEEETVLIVDWIKQGARDANGTPAPERAGARVRLHGTLREEWKLDALELIVTPSTRVDKSPIAGDYVQVRGRLRDDGAVIADRIRPR